MAGRRSLEPGTRVRVPPPLPRSQGRGVTGNTLGSGPRDCGFEACRPFHLADVARGVELPPCKREAWVRFPASASAFRGSTTAVQTAVNRPHAGSNPASGAIHHESSACVGMRPAATRQSRVRPSDDSPAPRPRRLAARTPDSQSGNEGSIPSGVTIASRSSRGPGRRPFKPATRVRVPHATPASGRGAAGARSAWDRGDAGSIPAAQTIISV